MAFEAVVQWTDEQQADLREWQGVSAMHGEIRMGLLPVFDVVIPTSLHAPKRGDFVTVHRTNYDPRHGELVVSANISYVRTVDAVGEITAWAIARCMFEPWTAVDE